MASSSAAWAVDFPIFWASDSAPTLFNCLIYANVAQEGPALFAEFAQPRLFNCTLYRNVARPFDGETVQPHPAAALQEGAACEGDDVGLTNCIFWENEPGGACGTADHCLVGVDPLFEEAGVFDFARTRRVTVAGAEHDLPDYVEEPPVLRPAETSPAEDAGTLEGTCAYDYAWRHRPAGSAPDIGAYELDASRASQFIRGDADSSAEWDLTDAVYGLSYLFLGEAEPSCLKAADADDNGALELTDSIYILGYLFLGEPSPLPPFGSCGFDLTADTLTCEYYEPCE